MTAPQEIEEWLVAAGAREDELRRGDADELAPSPATR